jgi:hypothetical protein
VEADDGSDDVEYTLLHDVFKGTKSLSCQSDQFSCMSSRFFYFSYTPTLEFVILLRFRFRNARDGACDVSVKYRTPPPTASFYRSGPTARFVPDPPLHFPALHADST